MSLAGLSQLQNVTVAPMRCQCQAGIVPTVHWARKWQSVMQCVLLSSKKWSRKVGVYLWDLKLGDKPGGNLHSQLQSHRMLPLPHLTTSLQIWQLSHTKAFSGPNDSNCSLFCPKIHISPYPLYAGRHFDQKTCSLSTLVGK